MAARVPLADGSIEQLLAQQLELAQRALEDVVEFNQAITKKLAEKGRDFPSAAAHPRQAMSPAAVSPSQIQDTGGLSTPLLTHDAVDKNKLAHASTLPDLGRLPAIQDADKGQLETKPSHKMDRRKSTTSREKRRPMFPSTDDVKKKLLDGLNKPVYNVEDLYKDHGWAQSISRDVNFQNATLMVIVLNTLWIAIDTDLNPADVLCNAPTVFIVVDNFFCIWFVFEITARFCSFERKRNAFGDAWFAFDAALVSLMVWETWIQVAIYLYAGASSSGGGSKSSSILRIFRIFRLTRVARMARLLRQMPELMVLVKGMLMAMRSVVATLSLLILIIYIFAIMFTQLLKGSPVPGLECFASVPSSMDCLLMHGVFPEAREFIGSMLEAGPVFFALIILYLLLASCTVMNMLIGVLCEVVSVVAKVEQEEANVRDLEDQVKRIMRRIGGDGAEDEDIDMDGAVITLEQFCQLKDDMQALSVLHELNIDVAALMGFADFLFRASDTLPLRSFFETVLQFRGGKQATVKDVVDVRKFICHEMGELEKKLVVVASGSPQT